MKIFITIVLFFSLALGVEKDENRQDNAQAWIQINIKQIESFDFTLFEKEYNLQLQHCIGKSICIFKPTSPIDLQDTLLRVKIYGKAHLYKPYKFKVY
ncbi:hypothetical protein KKG72_10390 [bacterium]|nr:hypothetical protein [bacterium]MBU1994459.1 hypothetical protein [bacterium]